MEARDGTQPEERDAELAVAELPPGRSVCLIVLVQRVAHFDAQALEGGKNAFQVIDSVLNSPLGRKNLEERVWLVGGCRVPHVQYSWSCQVKVQGERGVVGELVRARLVKVLAGRGESG